MGKLLLLFILVPAAELALLIELGRHLGTIPTLAVILLTGTLGAILARIEGLSVLRAAQEKMSRGELPAGSVADGIMILVAAALLITPGILTDALGFLLLVPAFRGLVKSALLRRFRRAVAENRVRVHVSGFGFPGEENGDPSFYSGPKDPFDPESFPLDGETKYKIH